MNSSSWVIIGCYLYITATLISGSLDGKYYVSTNYETFMQALINCKSAGLELASINSPEEEQQFEDFLIKNGYNNGYWLAGSNLGNNTYFWLSTGRPVTHSKWLPTQPDNAQLPENYNRGEHCIQWGLYNDSSNANGWNDLYCHLKLLYICQKSESCK